MGSIARVSVKGQINAKKQYDGIGNVISTLESDRLVYSRFTWVNIFIFSLISYNTVSGTLRKASRKEKVNKVCEQMHMFSIMIRLAGRTFINIILEKTLSLVLHAYNSFLSSVRLPTNSWG